jgi:hypothetical protein
MLMMMMMMLCEVTFVVVGGCAGEMEAERASGGAAAP